MRATWYDATGPAREPVESGTKVGTVVVEP